MDNLNVQTARPGNPFKTGLLLACMMLVVLIGSAWASVVLVTWLGSSGTALSSALLERGPHKVMRRLMIVLALPFIPFLLCSAGWRGWRDCGWSMTKDRKVDRLWYRDVLVGSAAGFLSLGIVSALQLSFGARQWSLEATPAEIAGKLVAILVAALAIACLEETAARGILFRVLQRMWTFWPAALVSSAVFAYAHYLEPDASAFGSGGIMEQTRAVLLSTFTKPGRVDFFLVNFANLTLMSVVLCTVVSRTGTVWMAVGLHAAWVGLIKFNFFSADIADRAAPSPWFGQRADATDGVLTSVMLVVLAVLAATTIRRRQTCDESNASSI